MGGQVDGGMQGGGEGGLGQPTHMALLVQMEIKTKDPNIPPDTINQGGTAPADNGQPPQPTDMATATGAQQEPSKKPPFIYNAHSEDSGPLYKDAEGNALCVKTGINQTTEPWERLKLDCPAR